MATMNISLLDSLKDFVDEQVNQRGFGTSSEYVRDLIRKEQDRLQLRGLLLTGASSVMPKAVVPREPARQGHHLCASSVRLAKSIRRVAAE